MSYRIERINSEMLKSISDIIANRVKDPRVEGMVSVLEVDVTKDLKYAKVYVSVYGDNADGTLLALNKCAGFIRKELSADFRELKSVPQVTFILDTSEQYSQKINDILKDLNVNDFSFPLTSDPTVTAWVRDLL